MNRSLWLALLGFFSLDRIAKGWALLHLDPDRLGPSWSFEILGLKCRASLQLVFNQGAAWGFFSDSPKQLLLIRICLISAICYCVWRSQNLKKAARFSWLCIAILALSNLLDVFLYGHIIDMISLRFDQWDFAVFNPADAVISIAWLALFTMQVAPKKSLNRRKR